MSDLYFITKQYNHYKDLWLQTLNQHENVSVVFFPRGDKLRRLNQMLDDKDLIQKHFSSIDSVHVFQIDFEPTLIEDDESFDLYLTRYLNRSYGSSVNYRSMDEWELYLKKEGKRMLLVMPFADKLLQKEYRYIHKSLDQTVRKHEAVINTLCFYEVDLNDPLYNESIREAPSLYSQVFNYPLYDEEDTLSFVSYLESKWNEQLKPKDKKMIYEKTAGHTWVIKELCRYMLTHDEPSFQQQSLDFKLNIIFKSFSHSQRRLLEKIVTAQPILENDDQRVLNYFKQMRFLNTENQFIGSIFRDYLMLKHRSGQAITMVDNKLFINDVPFDNFFSRKEYKVVKLLVEKKGSIVSREDIATAIWEENSAENYSDWAIDQLIARVRKRLEKLSFPSKIISSVRGKGYKFNI